MLSRAPASSESCEKSTAAGVTPVVNRLELALFSIGLGAATFAVLSLVRPDLRAAPGLALKLEISLIAAIAAAVLSLGWIVLRARRNNPSVSKKSAKARPFPTGASTAARPKDLLVELPTEKGSPSKEADEVVTQRPATEEEILAKADARTSDVIPPIPCYSNIDALASRIKAHRPSGGGQRTIVTGETEDVPPFSLALDLAKALGDTGAQTIIVDWSPSANGFSRSSSLDMRRGWNDLVTAKATFSEIIQRLPGTRAHAIASGEAISGARDRLDADLLNLTFDALDEVYDFIIVTGRHQEARVLFERIEGRFDAGVLATALRNGDIPVDPAGKFLGFDVADIDILRYKRTEPKPSQMSGRIALATRTREELAQRA
jgi:succinoglycan biosynthesis transport protein ExoP